MKLSDIKIRDSFKRTLPNQSKLDDCRDYFKRHGCIDRELVLNKYGYLIDGYVGYLVLLENGVAETDVVIRSGQHSTSTYRNSDTTYVFGYHTVSGKEYVWRLSKNKVDHEKVHIGSRVLVNTRHGNKVITVTKIETLASPPVTTPVKKVLRCFSD